MGGLGMSSAGWVRETSDGVGVCIVVDYVVILYHFRPFWLKLVWPRWWIMVRGGLKWG